MSPLSLRRYRAERLLRLQFEALRGRVIEAARARLGASGARLDRSDLDACYAQAWQGLYAVLLEGQEIANPTAWLTLVTFRRAIEELRTHGRVEPAGHEPQGANGMRSHLTPQSPRVEEPDFAAELDNRIRLRQLFEGLRGQLSAREREAASFCYLQGLSRPEAAARMGISQARMRKLMDGQGSARPGVAAKMGELAETIRAGAFCEEQGSLMRGLAYGILDPAGDRYRLALIHSNECPACRAYVASLRGLAAVLPPVLAPWGLGLAVLARSGVAMHGGREPGVRPGLGPHPGTAPHGGVGAAPATGTPIAGGLAGVGAPGAAGVGGAGGGWLLASGSLGAKLAVGCAIAFGVGAGCVALSGHSPMRGPAHRRGPALAARASAAGSVRGVRALSLAGAPGSPSVGAAVTASTGPSRGSSGALAPAQQAAREFGPEWGASASALRPTYSAGSRARAIRAAPTSAKPATAVASSSGTSTSAGTSEAAPPARAKASSAPTSGQPSSSAQREFGIE